MKCRHLIPLLAIAYVAAACGGSGNSEPTTTGPVFITDSLDSHDHVWVVVTKITLTSSAGASVDAFNDSDGQTVDLKTLRDPAGERYAFFGKVKSDTYTAVTITVDKDLVIFENGSSTGLLREFEGHNGTTAELTLTFASPRPIGPATPLAIDFDLSNWTDNGVTVTGSPFLVEGSGVAIGNLDRHERCNVHGTVRNLTGTAPNQTFRLDMSNTADVAVMTNSETVIGGLSSLSDGRRVRVRGAFSTSANAFVATSIYAEEEDDTPLLEGSVSDISVLDLSFDLEVEEAEFMLPMFTTVHVETNEATVFLNSQGQVTLSTDFFLALVLGNRLEVKGSYDIATNVMTASRVEFADEESD
jgi:hypothetical protein